MASAPATAQIDLAETGSYLWSGTAAIDADSTHLLVGSPDGLQIYRRHGVAELTVQAQIPVPGGIADIEIAGDWAYLLDGDGNLLALEHHTADSGDAPLDVKEGLGLRFIKTASTRLLAIDSSTAFCFDLTNPSTPSLISSLPYDGSGVGLDAADSLVLIPRGNQGLTALTLGADGSLHHASDFQPMSGGVPVSFNEVVTDGRHAWVPSGTNGVLIVDLTTPSSPSITGRIVTFGNARHAAYEDGRLVIADATVGLISYKITQDGSHLWQSELHEYKDSRILAASGPTRFYSTNGGRIFAFDISTLGGINFVGECGLAGGYNSLAHRGPWVFIPHEFGFYRAHADSIAADTSFFKFGNTKVYQALVHDNDLYTASGPNGVRRYRVFDEGTPVLLGTLPARDLATGIVVDRDTAIVLESGSGYRLFDVSIPSQPRIIGQDRKSTAFPTGVFPSTGFMYLAEGSGLLTVYDLEHPVKPERVRVVPQAARVAQMRVQDHRLYVGDRAAGFLTFTLANESNPVLISQPASPASVSAFWQSGRVLYTGDPGGHASAYDMIDPNAPLLLSSIYLDAPVIALEKVGEKLFVLTESALHTLSVGPTLVPGDFNADGLTDPLDMVALVDFVFGRGPKPWRPNSADVNADGRFNLQDVVRMVDYLYGDGRPLLIGAIE